MKIHLLIVLFGSLAIQLVSSQRSVTTWAANQNPGLGRMTTPPADFTEHQINMAIAQIHGAATENQAAYAAAAVYSPVMDMADNVQQALETKVRQLRTPANWAHPIPPPLPFGFDPMTLVLGAYYGTLNRNAPQNKASNTPPGSGPPFGMGPRGAMGPPTSIRRGGRPGNARRKNFGSAYWQTPGQFGFGQRAGASNTGSWGNWNNAAGVQGNSGPGFNNAARPTTPGFTTPASVTQSWTNPPYNANANPSWWKK